MQPAIIPRTEHPISRRDIDDSALEVLYRLYRAGHAAYLVGGCLRDLLLGVTPKDFDVATDAHPQRIRKLFRNCVLVGRRFRLAHVRFGSDVIEVSTFRRNPEPGEVGDGSDLLIRSDNTFGTPEDDALRRDFTINALYYDIGTYSLIDYVGGMRDVEDGFVRSIGDPCVRYQEDPVRMLRACKFAARLDFDIVEEDIAAIDKHRDLLGRASIARLLEEIFKLLRSGHAAACLKMLADKDLLPSLLPEVAEHLDRTGAAEDPEAAEFYRYLFALDDLLEHSDQPNANRGLLLSGVGIPLVSESLRRDRGPKDLWSASPQEIDDAFEAGMRPLLRRLTVSRRDSETLRQALLAQPRLAEVEPGSRAGQAAARRPGFHEAVDVLTLAAGVDESLRAAADDWRRAAIDIPPTPVEDAPRPRRRRRAPAD